MQKVGIAVDNYKLETFEKELSKRGYEIHEIVKAPRNTSLIRVNIEDNQILEFGKLVETINLTFRRN